MDKEIAKCIQTLRISFSPLNYPLFERYSGNSNRIYDQGKIHFLGIQSPTKIFSKSILFRSTFRFVYLSKLVQVFCITQTPAVIRSGLSCSLYHLLYSFFFLDSLDPTQPLHEFHFSYPFLTAPLSSRNVSMRHILHNKPKGILSCFTLLLNIYLPEHCWSFNNDRVFQPNFKGFFFSWTLKFLFFMLKL